MTKITNNTRETMSFTVAGNPKDGHPQTDSVEPGETKDLDVDLESAQVKGRILAGAITVPAATARKAGVDTGENGGRHKS